MSVRLPSALLVLALAACGRGGNDREEAPPAQESTASVFAVSLSDNVASPTADEVQRVVEKRYLAAIRRCHQQALRAHTDLPLRVRLFCRIEENGTGRVLTMDGDDSTFDQCVKGLVERWQFEAPRDTSGNPTTAHAEVVLSL